MDDLRKFLTSVLRSEAEGLSEDSISHKYRLTHGESLPFDEFGFDSAAELLNSHHFSSFIRTEKLGSELYYHMVGSGESEGKEEKIDTVAADMPSERSSSPDSVDDKEPYNVELQTSKLEPNDEGIYTICFLVKEGQDDQAVKNEFDFFGNVQDVHFDKGKAFVRYKYKRECVAAIEKVGAKYLIQGGKPRRDGCIRCGQFGHIGRLCPMMTGGKGYMPQSCFNCGEEGHIQRDCTKKAVKLCYNCKESGHLIRNCPKAANSDSYYDPLKLQAKQEQLEADQKHQVALYELPGDIATTDVEGLFSLYKLDTVRTIVSANYRKRTAFVQLKSVADVLNAVQILRVVTPWWDDKPLVIMPRDSALQDRIPPLPEKKTEADSAKTNTSENEDKLPPLVQKSNLKAELSADQPAIAVRSAYPTVQRSQLVVVDRTRDLSLNHVPPVSPNGGISAQRQVGPRQFSLQTSANSSENKFVPVDPSVRSTSMELCLHKQRPCNRPLCTFGERCSYLHANLQQDPNRRCSVCAKNQNVPLPLDNHQTARSPYHLQDRYGLKSTDYSSSARQMTTSRHPPFCQHKELECRNGQMCGYGLSCDYRHSWQPQQDSYRPCKQCERLANGPLVKSNGTSGHCPVSSSASDCIHKRTPCSRGIHCLHGLDCCFFHREFSQDPERFCHLCGKCSAQMKSFSSKLHPGGSSSSFDESVLEKNLKVLDTTEPCIQKWSKWCIQFGGYHASIVQLWLKVFKSVSPKTRLALMYLANDICQVAKRAKMDNFLLSFTPAIKESFGLIANDPMKEKVMKILGIWKKRVTFPVEYTNQLEEILARKPHKKILAKLSETGVAEFKPEEFVDEVKKLNQLDTSIRDAKEQLKVIKTEFSKKSQTKDKRRCHKMMKECEETSVRLADMLRDLEKQFKRRASLISSLETAEIFYETQMEQATSVIEHFEKYGARIQSVQALVEEKLEKWSNPDSFGPASKRQRSSTDVVSAEGLHINMNQSFFTHPPQGLTDQFNDVWSDAFGTSDAISVPEVNTETPSRGEPSFGAFDYLSGLMASGSATADGKTFRSQQSQDKALPPPSSYSVTTPSATANFNYFPSQINAVPLYPPTALPPPSNFLPVQKPQPVYPTGPQPLFPPGPPLAPPQNYATAPLTVRPYQIAGGPISPDFYSPTGANEYDQPMVRLLPTVNLCSKPVASADRQQPRSAGGYGRHNGGSAEPERWGNKNPFTFDREFTPHQNAVPHAGVNQSNLRVLTSGGADGNAAGNRQSDAGSHEQNRVEISSALHNNADHTTPDELEVSSAVVD